MRPAFPEGTAILVIRFTRRIARQCHPHGPGFPDWVICDTIANGSRKPAGRPLGTIVRFERKYASATVRVLGRLTPEGCLALQVLAPATTRKKMCGQAGFLIRPSSK
jgi:hypothetical protein